MKKNLNKETEKIKYFISYIIEDIKTKIKTTDINALDIKNIIGEEMEMNSLDNNILLPVMEYFIKESIEREKNINLQADNVKNLNQAILKEKEKEFEMEYKKKLEKEKNEKEKLKKELKEEKLEKKRIEESLNKNIQDLTKMNNPEKTKEVEIKESKIKVICKISNKALFMELKEIIKFFNDIQNKNESKESTFARILNKANKHFKKFLDSKQYLGIDSNGNILITDNDIGEGDHKLKLESPLIYPIFSKEIIFYDEEAKSNIIPFGKGLLENYQTNLFDKVNIVLEERKNENSTNINEENLVRNTRFLKFIIHIGNSLLLEERIIDDIKYGYPYVHITTEQIKKLSYNFKEKEKGLKQVGISLEKSLNGFTNPLFDRPKGILFYGPPRTGKTFTTDKIINNLHLFKIYPEMSAGDFAQGIVGQSEKMIDAITKRCDVIPWELCILFIDEVDSLVPNRNLSTSSNSQNSIIGQFLSIIDGNKKKKNLLIIATTNRLEQMDPAFAQRMDIKIFLGVPNFEARMNWINNFIDEYIKRSTRFNNKTNITNLMILNHSEDLKAKLAEKTLNFSADSMKKILQNIIIGLQIDNKKETPDEVNKEIQEQLNLLCNNDKLYFGKFFLPLIVNDLPDYNKNQKFNYLIEMLQIIKYNTQYKPRKRVLVDLSDTTQENFQIEIESPDYLTYNQKGIIDSVYGINDQYINIQKIDISNEIDYGFNMDQILQQIKKIMPQLTENFKNVKDYKDLLNEMQIIMSGKFKGISDKQNYFSLIKNFLAKTESKYGNNSDLLTFGPPLEDCMNKEEVIKVLIKLAIEKVLDYVLLLDIDYFFKRALLSDEKISEEINMLVQECNKYEKSMIIIDFDSICSNTKEYSQLTEDLQYSNTNAYKVDGNESSFTYRSNRPLTFQTCINIMESCIFYQSETWIFALTSHNKTTSDIKSILKWPESRTNKKINEGIEEINKERTCKRCCQIYTNKQNSKSSCSRHISTKLYSEVYFEMLKEEFSNKKKRDIDSGRKLSLQHYPNVLDIPPNHLKDFEDVLGEINISQYRYICCQKGIFEKGEIPDEHEE